VEFIAILKTGLVVIRMIHFQLCVSFRLTSADTEEVDMTRITLVNKYRFEHFGNVQGSVLLLSRIHVCSELFVDIIIIIN